MSYCSPSDVAALVPNLVNGASNFSASTLPTNSQVTLWLSNGCAILENEFIALGYTAPSSGTGAYQQLADLNALYGAARAELVRMNVRIGPGERTRSQLFEEMFWDGIKRFKTQDLSRLGMGACSAGYVGGISDSDKQAVADDGDRIPTRFATGQFAYKGSSCPTRNY